MVCSLLVVILAGGHHLPANFTLVQHDHVIITVNDDCQIQEWDQVADFVEANAVTLAFGAIMYENGAYWRFY